MSDLTEEKVIKIFKEVIGQPKQRFSRIGDDVVYLPTSRRSKVIVNSDMLVKSTDVPPRMSLWQASRKALIMSASDLAAKGVRPNSCLISIALPGGYSEKDIRDLARGVKIAKDELGTEFLGGDTNSGNDLIIDCTMIGFADRIISRGGAKVGDQVYVTGEFGLTGAGMLMLFGEYTANLSFRKKAIDSVLLPKARVDEGVGLSKKELMSASIDSSDGLAISLYLIAESSNVRIELDTLPLAVGLIQFASDNNIDPEALALYSGEEFEIVFSTPGRKAGNVNKVLRRYGRQAVRIGSVTKGKPSVFLQGKLVKRKGWMHRSDSN